MIRLLEHEGKQLLARHGIAIPAGGLYPDLPADLPGPYVIKAQVLAGGRGKLGGIRFAETLAEVARESDALAGWKAGEEVSRGTYVEEKLSITREYYVAALVDRDLGMPVLMASRFGGVDIETVPAEDIIRQPVDPLIGLRPYMVANIVRRLGLRGTEAASFSEFIRKIHALLVGEDAELVEVNPAVLNDAGDLIAADAKIVLDEDALYRHQHRPQEFRGTPFECAARALGVIGVELDGDIAAVMNGAGMTMATLDQLVATGGRVRGLVELHGAKSQGPQRIAEILELVGTLAPKAILLNFYYQFRPLETIAEGISIALKRTLPERRIPLVIRMRGVNQEKATGILRPLGCEVTDDFELACRRVVELTSGAPAAREATAWRS